MADQAGEGRMNPIITRTLLEDRIDRWHRLRRHVDAIECVLLLSIVAGRPREEIEELSNELDVYNAALADAITEHEAKATSPIGNPLREANGGEFREPAE